MRFFLFGLCVSLVASTAYAQQVEPVETTRARGAILRGLDMANGRLVDITIANGESAVFERLEITLSECRYPTDQSTNEAYASLTIRDTREDVVRFEGWMVASSPALSSLDHPRYDIWLLSCDVEVVEVEAASD